MVNSIGALFKTLSIADFFSEIVRYLLGTTVRWEDVDCIVLAWGPLGTKVLSFTSSQSELGATLAC